MDFYELDAICELTHHHKLTKKYYYIKSNSRIILVHFFFLFLSADHVQCDAAVPPSAVQFSWAIKQFTDYLWRQIKQRDTSTEREREREDGRQWHPQVGATAPLMQLWSVSWWTFLQSVAYKNAGVYQSRTDRIGRRGARCCCCEAQFTVKPKRHSQEEGTTAETHHNVLTNGKSMQTWVLNIDHRECLNWTYHQSRTKAVPAHQMCSHLEYWRLGTIVHRCV